MRYKRNGGKIKRVVYFPLALDKRIRLEAVKRDTNRSDVIVKALEQFLDNIDWDEQISADVKGGRIKGLYPRERV